MTMKASKSIHSFPNLLIDSFTEDLFDDVLLDSINSGKILQQKKIENKRPLTDCGVNFEEEMEHIQISKRASYSIEASMRLLRPNKNDVVTSDDDLFSLFCSNMSVPEDLPFSDCSSVLDELISSTNGDNNAFWNSIYVMEQEK